jgi:hypothetical protein
MIGRPVLPADVDSRPAVLAAIRSGSARDSARNTSSAGAVAELRILLVIWTGA